MRQEETTNGNEYINKQPSSSSPPLIILSSTFLFHFMFFYCLTELDMKFSFAILAFSTRQDLVAGSSTVKKVW